MSHTPTHYKQTESVQTKTKYTKIEIDGQTKVRDADLGVPVTLRPGFSFASTHELSHNYIADYFCDTFYRLNWLLELRKALEHPSVLLCSTVYKRMIYAIVEQNKVAHDTKSKALVDRANKYLRLLGDIPQNVKQHHRYYPYEIHMKEYISIVVTKPKTKSVENKISLKDKELAYAGILSIEVRKVETTKTRKISRSFQVIQQQPAKSPDKIIIIYPKESENTHERIFYGIKLTPKVVHHNLHAARKYSKPKKYRLKHQVIPLEAKSVFDHGYSGHSSNEPYEHPKVYIDIDLSQNLVWQTMHFTKSFYNMLKGAKK